MSAIADRPVPLADRAGGSGLRRLDRITAYAPPGLLLIASFAVGAARLAGAAPGPGVGSVVLVAGLLVGLPHGALDVERVVTGRRGHARALVGCGYVASAAAAFLAWLVRPAAAVVALVVLAWLHFGLTDLTEVVRRGRRSVPAALKVEVVGACCARARRSARPEPAGRRPGPAPRRDGPTQRRQRLAGPDRPARSEGS